jgi:transposase
VIDRAASSKSVFRTGCRCGRSRGGRTTKIHGLSDPLCRPVVLHLTTGQDADIAAAPDVLALAPAMRALIADKGYDGDDLRAQIVDRGAKLVIPNKSNRVVMLSTSAPTKAATSSNAASVDSRTSAGSAARAPPWSSRELFQ